MKSFLTGGNGRAETVGSGWKACGKMNVYLISSCFFILLRNLLIFNVATDATEDYIKIIEPIK